MTTALSKYKSAQAELRHAKAELKQWRDKEFPVGTKVIAQTGKFELQGTVVKLLPEPTVVLVKPKGGKKMAVKYHVRDIERIKP